MENENEGVEEVVQDAPTEQENALETEGSEGAADPEESTEIDYKSELVKAQEVAENYKKGMLIAKDKLKNKKGVDPEDIAKIVGEVLSKELSSIKGALNMNTLDSSLNALTTNPAKKELIRFHYENSIVKSGEDPQSIKNDLENALLIADKKSLLKDMKELAISAKNRSQIGNNSMGGSDKPSSSKKFFSDEQKKDLKKRGFTDKMIDDLIKNMAKQKEGTIIT